MLLTQEQLKKLKPRSVSKDTEKTKERFTEDFKAASAEQKRAIAETCGQAVRSFYCIYDTGSITARAVLGTAMELNVSPFYFTGEADEKEPCSEELVRKFLEDNDYADIAAELGEKDSKTKRTYNRKMPKEAEVAQEADGTTILETDAPALTNETAETPASKTEAQKIPEYKPMTDEEIEAATAHDYALYKASMEEEATSRPVPDLTEDEVVLLLRAMFVRAKAGGSAACELVEVKRRLLL